MTTSKPDASAFKPAVNPFLTLSQALPVAVVGVLAFHAAYWNGSLSFLVAVFLFCLFRLTFLKSSRQAMYLGLGIGLAVYAPQLGFFWTIFGMGAIPLWLIVSCWIGFYLVLGSLCLRNFGIYGVTLASPFLWMGLEYFRSELYFFRFSWVTPGLAFSDAGELPLLATYGVYGISFMILTAASLFFILPTLNKRNRIVALIFLGCLLLYPAMVEMSRKSVAPKTIHVAGIEMPFPTDQEVIKGLTKLTQKFPQAELLVLSEFTFHGPIPESVKQWCKTNGKYLIAGGEDGPENGAFYNTAFVVDPQGSIVFQQAKSRPVQFFKDGLPARERKVWNSPWGPLAIAICNDSGYRRALDDFAALGAQALIIPTMDAEDWGVHQHLLHAGVVRMRAAEYQIPVVRLCCTGTSEFVKSNGSVLTSTPFMGDLSMIEGVIEIGSPARLPADRWAAPVAVVVTAAIASWFASLSFIRWRLLRKAGRR